MQTSQDQLPDLALNLSNKSFLGSVLFSVDEKGELFGVSSEVLPKAKEPNEGFAGSAGLAPKRNGVGESVLATEPNTTGDSDFLGSAAPGFARKLNESEAAGVDAEKPPNPANTFFFSPPSPGFLLRAVLITRPFISRSLAFLKCPAVSDSSSSSQF